MTLPKIKPVQILSQDSIEKIEKAIGTLLALSVVHDGDVRPWINESIEDLKQILIDVKE